MGLGQELFEALRNEENDKIEELLDWLDASTVNEASAGGSTPLHTACWRNNEKAVAKLLAIQGVEVNARTNGGWTPTMMAAAHCSCEALKLMVDHPTVDLDVEDNDGKGLEENVGKFAEESKCLEMIKEARRQRENVDEDHTQEICVNEFLHIGNSLEEMRDNFRKQIIEKIDKVNEEKEKMENKIKDNVELRTKLEKEDREDRQLLANLEKKINKNTDLRNKLEKEEAEDNQRLVYLKEMTDELAKFLRKLDTDCEDNSTSNIEAARETLECPVCMNMMKPPERIWMCSSSHLVCEPCKDSLEEEQCPTCRTEKVSLRAFIAEKFAKNLF